MSKVVDTEKLIHPAREAWLLGALEFAKPMFAAQGKPIPEQVRVGIGQTSKKKYIGECWSEVCSDDAHREIWIRPYTTDPFEITGVLVHELAHASLPFGVKHKTPFVKLVRPLHLEGKPTSTVIGTAFKDTWSPLLKQLGRWPGGVFDPRNMPKKKTGTVQIKMCCPECDVKFYMTPKMQQSVGVFSCVDADCDGIPTGPEGDDE
jgi:hypothetical protein